MEISRFSRPEARATRALKDLDLTVSKSPPARLQQLLTTLALTVCLSTAQAAPEPAIADNGREVVLNEDGTWEFIGEDRFATTADGRRIRLKADGSWEPADSADADRYGFSQAGGFSRDVAQVDGTEVRLDEVVIETVRSRRGKNSLEASQMVFIVRHDDARRPPVSAAGFLVTDSRGREYQTATVTSKPGGVIEVRTEDSPGFTWGIKHYRLTIASDVFGTDQPVVLTKVKGDVIDREVDELSGT